MAKKKTYHIFIYGESRFAQGELDETFSIEERSYSFCGNLREARKEGKKRIKSLLNRILDEDYEIGGIFNLSITDNSPFQLIKYQKQYRLVQHYND